MRLIDADALMADVRKNSESYFADDFAHERVDRQPTIDAVPVVRCKDCLYYNAGFECLKEGYGIEYPQDWFCAGGQRREDGDNGKHL